MFTEEIKTFFSVDVIVIPVGATTVGNCEQK